MKRKTAQITAELVDESIMEKDEKIVLDLFQWFRTDAVSMPWVKEVKRIRIRGTAKS